MCLIMQMVGFWSETQLCNIYAMCGRWILAGVRIEFEGINVNLSFKSCFEELSEVKHSH